MFTIQPRSGKLAGIVTLLLFVCLITTSNQAHACDRASFTLDAINMTGPEYEINATVRMGAGITGSVMGGGANTYSFGFGFFFLPG
jgi:hypothetical protein